MDKLFYVFSVLGAYTIAFLGGWDSLLQLVVVCIVVDFATGVIKAVRFKELSSKISYKGILKKLSMLLFIGFAHMLDILMFDMGLRTLAIGAVIAHESLSITENMGRLGVPIPKKIKDVLKQLQDDTEGDVK